MAATTGPRKTVSIYDYPEHLNPFREDDNHNKIRFWTLGKKLNRSNSINFSGIKDLKNSWALRSFMKKGKKNQQPPTKDSKTNNQVNGGDSPIVFRRALQYSSASTAGSRSTVASPERADRYVYGGSITPLPRSRFQERLRSTSNYEVNSLSATPCMSRSEVSGSRLSVESTNPFEETAPPVPPVRASRRKKKRAAPLPPGTADISMNSANSELQISEVEERKDSNDADLDIEKMNLNIELKIVEDEDTNTKKDEGYIKKNENGMKDQVSIVTNVESTASVQNTMVCEDHDKNTVEITKQLKNNDNEPKDKKVEISETLKITEDSDKRNDAQDSILDNVSFPKVDIHKYRRNSSVNEDDIRLRRGNLEEFFIHANKRSQSLNNALDFAYVTYDVNLNENSTKKDANDNDQPQKVICKVYDESSRKQSVDNSISSTEKEFIEIDRATRELEREISKLNSALIEDDEVLRGTRLSVSDIKRKFDRSDVTSPNPIPKPRRSPYGGSSSPVNGTFQP